MLAGPAALDDGERCWTMASGSAVLAGEVQRPRVGPVRDIVATIQPEQDEIVRADLGTTACAQVWPSVSRAVRAAAGEPRSVGVVVADPVAAEPEG